MHIQQQLTWTLEIYYTSVNNSGKCVHYAQIYLDTQFELMQTSIVNPIMPDTTISHKLHSINMNKAFYSTKCELQ